MQLTVYKSPTCPKCKILCDKLDKKGVQYQVSTDIEEMQKLGIKSLPTVIMKYDFSEANKWVNQLPDPDPQQEEAD